MIRAELARRLGGPGPALRALALGLAVLLGGCKSNQPNGIALVGATVLDGSGGAPLTDAVVVVRGQRIESIGPRAGFTLPDRTVEVDVSGRWIIPGLIDSHAHLAPWTLPRYLAWGVTTVRDVHGTLDSIMALRQQTNAGAVESPRVYSAGAMIDGLPSTYPDALGANQPGDARQAVDKLAVAGVDYVMVFSHVDPTLLRAIVDESKAFNLKVTGHLGLTDAITAARIGVGSIEHMTGVPEAATADASPLVSAHYRSFFAGWTAFERSWAGLDSAALARVARELVQRKVTVIPTLVLHETYSRLDDPAVLQDSSLAAVPETEQRKWNVPDLIARAGWTAADYQAFRRSRALQDLFVREFHSAGGVVAAGTDASNQLLVPGESEHRELELLVRAGLSPGDALAAATRNGAALLGADSLGRLAPGTAADLVILTRDPLADIRNTRSIDRVMVRGRLLSADSIRSAW